MRGPCVTCYGLIQMIVVDGVFRRVVQAILLVKIFRKPLIKEMDFS